MKARISTVSLLVLCLLMVACATSPSRRWAQGAVAFTLAENSISAFHDAGIITDEQLVTLKPALVGGKATLDKARGYLPAGGPVFDVTWAGFEAYLNTLVAAQSAAELKGKTQ